MRERKMEVRISRLSEQRVDTDSKRATASERLAMMWQLALDAWAFRGDRDAESRLPRHVVRVVRTRS